MNEEAVSRRAVMLAGGWAHPPADSVAAMTRLLARRGLETVVVTDPAAVASTVGTGCDLLVISACWFSMTDERYDEAQRRAHAVRSDPVREAALDRLRLDGCPLLALHTAVICFDGWQPWRQWLGGVWNWETSWHPPPAEVAVEPVSGAPASFEPFTVVDEEYQGLAIDAAVSIVARSGDGHPLVWLNESAQGRAAVDLLGHDARSLDDPRHEALIDSLLDGLLRDR